MSERHLYQRGLSGLIVDCLTEAHPDTFVTVDADDFDWVSSRKWSPADNGSGQLYFYSAKGPKNAGTEPHKPLTPVRYKNAKR